MGENKQQLLNRPRPSETHSFRPPFSVKNSTAAVARFPFPLASVSSSKKPSPFRYSVNVAPHSPSGIAGSVDEYFFDIDEFYYSELAERQLTLAQYPQHHWLTNSMKPAAWELLANSLKRLARDYPHYFTLTINGNHWHWHNQLTGDTRVFNLDKNTGLDDSPLMFLGSQLPGDWALLQQQDDQLYLQAGLITGPAGWSLQAVRGMDYYQWHAPVPDDYQVFKRSLNYLLRLPADQPVRRTNWGLCVDPRLHMSLDNQQQWRNAWQNLSPQDFGQRVNLRVEWQVLERLPKSKAIAFYIKTYFLTLADMQSQPDWLSALRHALETMPEAIARYKNLHLARPQLLDFLNRTS